MSKDEIIKLFESDSDDWEGDNAFKGLQIIAKYIDCNENELIIGAEHDIIYSYSIDQLVEKGITDEDLKELRRLNWHIEEDDYFACFV